MVLAGDERDYFLVAVGVKVENGNVHGETVDGSAHDLDFIKGGGTSPVEPGVEIVVVPGRIDHLVLGQPVHGQLQLALAELDLFLCAEGGEVGVNSQQGREQ